MSRNVMSLKGLGRDASWLLVQQALGMPDAKMQSDYMEDRVAVLMFARRSLPERLCVTAAVRQMGGTTIFEGDPGGVWRQEVQNFQKHMLSILEYYIDCMYIYGFPVPDDEFEDSERRFPVINAGSPNSHPAHALADLACILRVTPDLNGLRAAWIGSANGTLYSLLEITGWFPMELSISLPPHADIKPLQKIVAGLKSNVTFTTDPEKAVKGAKFIFAGRREEDENPEHSRWSITERLVSLADPHFKLLLSASPLRAIPVDVGILSSPASLLVRQAEYRLRIHKRILHWVFQTK